MKREGDKINSIRKIFELIGKSEKSIEQIYDFLLRNKKIEDLRRVSNELGITLKRGYKVCAVLNELDLIQIFDRPMKINLLNPIVAWQKIINKKINELSEDLDKKINTLEESLNSFFKVYELKEPEVGEPIEFLNFDTKNLNWVYYPYFANRVSRIAIGIAYENPFINELTKGEFSIIEKELAEILAENLRVLAEHVRQIEIFIVLNSNVLEAFLNSIRYKKLVDHLNIKEMIPQKIQVRITHEDFSNFALRDDEMLIQPSFDPSNILLGSYISRQKDIVKIFKQKFDDLFENSLQVNDYLRDHRIFEKSELSNIDKLALGFLQ